MKRVHEVCELRAELDARRRAGERIALVPTMGSLHAGHASLVALARTRADCVVASVFVNPLQFAPGEDFERYPRSLPADCAVLEREGADYLFAPAIDQVYPNGFPPSTTVQLSGALVEQLEGWFRPGHFQGVATVVNILFNLVQPAVAVFGEKDYQQLAVIRRMVSDLGMPIEIVGAPTVREDASGLALSSRNQYLGAEDRLRSGQIYQVLQAAASWLRAGRRDFADIEAEACGRLRDAGLEPQYVAVRAPDLGPPQADGARFVLLAAAFIGRTRLIDNLSVCVKAGP